MKVDSSLQYKYKGVLSKYLEYKRLKMAQKWIIGAEILDLGCCQAKLLESEHDNINYVGIDHNDELRDFNHKRYPNQSFITADLNTIHRNTELLRKRTFTTVLLLAVIEHLENPQDLIIYVKQLLSPSGRIILTTPNPHSESLIDIGSKFGFFAKEGIDEHKPLMSRSELTNLATDLELELIHYERFSFWLNQLIVLQNSTTKDYL